MSRVSTAAPFSRPHAFTRSLVLLASLLLASCAGTLAPRPLPLVPGITAYLWRVDASDTVVQSLLSRDDETPHAIPFGEGPAALWRANGVRVLAIPSDAAFALRQQAAPTGALREYEIGESPAWTELAQGVRWTGPLLTRLDTGDVRLGPGYLRLLCRTWVIPAEIPEGETRMPAAVQLELAIQHVREIAPERGTIESMIPAAPTTLDRQGLILDRLTLSAALTGESAVVLLSQTQAGSRSADEPPIFGPPPPEHVRLGDLLLGRLVPESGGKGVMIVLIPGVPESFGLSPQAR